MLYDLEKLCAHVRQRLTPARYNHSIAVQKRAVQLAKQYGADWFKAGVAGLVHDICHDMDYRAQLNYLQGCGILLDVLTLENPPVWHAVTGAQYIRDEMGIEDEAIIDAVRYHTTGRREMSLLEKVVYVADLTSEDRQFPGAEEYRMLADQSLETVLRSSLRHTAEKVLAAGKPLVQNTWEAYNYYTLAREERKEMTSYEIVEYVARLLDDKKATDISVLEIGDLTPLGDYFVIASGGSNTQVKTLSEEIEDKLAALGIEPKKVDGEQSAVWILMDYGDVIIHIFQKDTRDFYCLERLWADAKTLDVSRMLKEEK